MPADVGAFRRPSARKPDAKAQPEVNVRTRKPIHASNPPWKAPVRVQEPPKEWISGEAFKELESLDGLGFGSAGRDSINDAISTANWIWEAAEAKAKEIAKLRQQIAQEPKAKKRRKLREQIAKLQRDDNGAEAKAKEIAKLRQQIAQLRRQLRVVEASSIPGRGRTLLELWQEATGIQLPMDFWGPGPEVDRRIGSFDRFAAAQVAGLRQKRKRGSPKRFQHLDTLIWIVAETYAREGGVPSAAYQVLSGRRQTPFLRMLRFIHLRLPASMRATSEKALDKRASEVISDMKRWRNDMGFPSWVEQRKDRNQRL